MLITCLHYLLHSFNHLLHLFYYSLPVLPYSFYYIICYNSQIGSIVTICCIFYKWYFAFFTIIPFILFIIPFIMGGTCRCPVQPGAWALEKSLTRPSFFLYFREIRKKRSHRPGGQSAPRLYNRYNHCPCARPAHVGECGPGPEFKFSKTVQVGWSC